MKDLLDKAMYLGIGCAVTGKEKIEEMLEKGEISREQAKEIMVSFLEKGSEQTQKIKTFIQMEMQKMQQDEWVSREAFACLEMRVKVLEEKLAGMEEK